MRERRLRAKVALSPGQALLELAAGGCEALRPRVRALLSAEPDARREFGDLAAQSARLWARLFASTDVVRQEAILLEAAERADRLARGAKTDLELVLAERFQAAWLEVEYYKMHEVMLIGQGVPSGEQGRAILKRRAAGERIVQGIVMHVGRLRQLLSDKNFIITHTTVAGEGAGPGRRGAGAGGGAADGTADATTGPTTGARPPGADADSGADSNAQGRGPLDATPGAAATADRRTEFGSPRLAEFDAVPAAE